MLRLLVLVAALCVVAPAGVVVAQDESVESGARDTVATLQDALLAAMRLDADQTARERLLAAPVERSFDFDSIARISLGRTWRDLDAAARGDFAQRLEQLIVATYASRFARYTGQQFEILGTEPVRGGVVVRTRLHRSDGPTVRLDYYLREGRIFNVVADGVSDLALRRADYARVVESGGYAALLDYIDASTADRRSADDR
ncbi:MAG: ABC transporter substrate-binding protein [Pseudomonadales bacterium]